MDLLTKDVGGLIIKLVHQIKHKFSIMNSKQYNNNVTILVNYDLVYPMSVRRQHNVVDIIMYYLYLVKHCVNLVYHLGHVAKGFSVHDENISGSQIEWPLR